MKFLKKRRETHLSNKEKAILSKKLVTLKDDVPVKDSLNSFILKPVKKEDLYDFLRNMEFNRLLSQAISFYGEIDNLKTKSKTSLISKSKNKQKLYESILTENDLENGLKF